MTSSRWPGDVPSAGPVVFMHCAVFNVPGRFRAVVLTAALSLAATALAQTPSRPAAVANGPKDENVTTLSVFTVTGEKDDGYRSTQTISGSRTVEELKDIANSISIFNRELIDDLQVTTVAELSDFGLTGERNADPREQERFVFRGIANNYQLRDGFIWYLPVDIFSVHQASNTLLVEGCFHRYPSLSGGMRSWSILSKMWYQAPPRRPPKSHQVFGATDPI